MPASPTRSAWARGLPLLLVACLLPAFLLQEASAAATSSVTIATNGQVNRTADAPPRRLLRGRAHWWDAPEFFPENLEGLDPEEEVELEVQEDVTFYFPGKTKPLWESVDGEVRLNGHTMHIKGINWFGFETDTRVVHGLDTHGADFYLDLLRDHGFNLLRLPISLAAALDLESYPRYHFFQDATFRGRTVRQLLQQVIHRAGERGILVLLDMHRARENEKWELWYTRDYSYADLLRGWNNLMHAYKHEWNVMGIDLLNEPHGLASWESGDRAVDWNRAAEDMIAKLAAAHADWPGLFFVEGVNGDHPFKSFWGSNFHGARTAPLDLRHVSEDLDRRVVYSPHTYGPSVEQQTYFTDKDFPRNMPRIWDVLFGFLEGATGRAVVMGEFGGFYRDGTANKVFLDAFADYLLDRCLSDVIYWVMNPNSGDTGGLLRNDWTTPRLRRAAMLHRIQPVPSRLFFDGSKYVFKPGAYARPECDPRGGIGGDGGGGAPSGHRHSHRGHSHAHTHGRKHKHKYEREYEAAMLEDDYE